MYPITSIIQKSQIEGAHRLDAEYYQPEYLSYTTLLKKIPLASLSDLCQVSDGNHMTISEQFVDSGVRYLRGKDLQDFFISDSDPVYIPNSIYGKLKRSHIFFEDVLVSIVGTVGLVGIVADKRDVLTGNCKIAILHPQKINPWFLSLFLASKYGKYQLARMTGGAVQAGVILKDLLTLQVPNLNENVQGTIAQTLKRAHAEQKNSKNFYQQAENLLLEEFGLKNLQLSSDLTFVVNFSEVEKAKRLDADYFQSRYELLVNKLGSKKKLSEFAKRVYAPVKIVPDKQYNYIEISDVNVESGEIVFDKIMGKELPANAKTKVSGGELIISKVRPTRGAIAIIPQEFTDDFIASGAFSVFKVNYPTREYLQIVFRSIVGKLQLERPTTGTSYPTITDEDIENMWIPHLSFNLQQKIANLVRKSHEARKKSKELLEEAKREVEEMIEKGGD